MFAGVGAVDEERLDCERAQHGPEVRPYGEACAQRRRRGVTRSAGRDDAPGRVRVEDPERLVVAARRRSRGPA